MSAFIKGEWQDGEVRGVNFLAGFRGMGKTTEMGRLMNGCSGTVVFYDHKGTHPSLLRGAVTLTQPGDLKDAFLARRGHRMRVRYVPPRAAPDFSNKKKRGWEPEHVTHFRAVCAICDVFGRAILCADEMDNYCGPQWGSFRMPPELYTIVHEGRHSPLSMIFTARDPTTISPNVRSQCETLRIFRTVEESYVEYFQARIGKEMAARLYTLPEYQYVLSSASIPYPAIYNSGKFISR